MCSLSNLDLAFKKAKKGKTHVDYVKNFEENLNNELQLLHTELTTQTYAPRTLKRFTIRDPKTRVIHASAFRDRVVYPALVNILEPIYERIFIYDSYASRKEKGTHKAVQRFDFWKRKITKNGQKVKNASNNNHVQGYCLKADIWHYFDTVDHNTLLTILQKKIQDRQVLWLIQKILHNFENSFAGKGMPLGNLTSQFFANVYLNELDYFVKHVLKAKYYMRYVDDFVILHQEKKTLSVYKEKINMFLKDNLQLELHPSKSKIIPLRNGITLLGYVIFYHYKILRKSNRKKFERNFSENLVLYEKEAISDIELMQRVKGWCGYAQWANTYRLRRKNFQILQETINTNTIPYPIEF